MRLTTFLHHQWQSFWRTRNANKSFVLQIVLGIFYLLVFLEIAVLGIALPFLIKDMPQAKAPIDFFCSYIIYYFLIGLIMRFQFQDLPSLSIQPYLTQNIPRKKMLHFLNVRSLVHLFNFLPLFVFIPFTIVDIMPKYSILTGILFIISMLALVLNNHFLNLYIKRKSMDSSWWFVGAVLAIVALKGLDYFKLISFEKASAQLFIGLLQYPWLSVLPIALATATFLKSNQYLRAHFYLEEIVSEQKLKISNRYAVLNKYGEIGEMIALDLKLIFRNKRPKSLVIMSGVILLYGFLFYPKYLQTGNDTMLFFFASIITGLFITNFGQFLFAWQSSHFDGMMSSNINIKQYIKAKFALLVTVSFLQFLMASLYGFMSRHLLPIQLAAFLFGIGINAFVTIYAATFSYKCVDLRRSASMNFQGIGTVQWLQSLLSSFGPTALFYLLNRFAGFWPAVICISGLGLMGLIFTNAILHWLTQQFNGRRYKILEGFREK